ncbi:MAG: alpha-L-fucosidase, partial [Myxococcota bacterium]|nr:alpha-L-fucosidase [Myxococcota bacterium]
MGDRSNLGGLVAAVSIGVAWMTLGCSVHETARDAGSGTAQVDGAGVIPDGAAARDDGAQVALGNDAAAATGDDGGAAALDGGLVGADAGARAVDGSDMSVDAADGAVTGDATMFLLPTLAPMPPIPAARPLGSVPMGDPATFPEVKMDFAIESGPFGPTWASIASNYSAKESAWLRQAKFGIWVHFGPQAAGQSGDWYARKMYIENATWGSPAYANHIRDFGHPSVAGYKDFLQNWNPTALDPAALTKIYSDAGARFLLIQGVHHDQYDNWNSRYQPWNSVTLSPHRDILGEWKTAIRAAGMHFGVTFHHEYTWWWWQSAFRSDVTNNQGKLGVPYDAVNLSLSDGVGKWWQGIDPRLLYGINLREYTG